VLEEGRPTVGVAFGGGSARGIAHVGVIRWLEEHRIPIDVAAGTSMGGLVGGAYATGMEPDELQAFISNLDWDQLFGASTFAYKNIRRKTDARAYPSRLEFGLKGGIVPPTSLNSGEYVELLLGRIAAPYFDMKDFDDLPTPFRTVAVDLLSAQPIIMCSGSLADAMRATMSLPLIFPPTQVNGQVLIDGGTMDNVPADVVKAMGATHVIAVNVGDLTDRQGVSYTMFGVAGSTLDAMMRASTRRAIAAADVVIDVPLEKYGSLDWRRAPALIDEGYRAAEAMRDRLLPCAVSEEAFEAWRRTRQARRLKELPTPTFIEAEGFVTSDTKRLDALLARPVTIESQKRAERGGSRMHDVGNHVRLLSHCADGATRAPCRSVWTSVAGDQFHDRTVPAPLESCAERTKSSSSLPGRSQSSGLDSHRDHGVWILQSMTRCTTATSESPFAVPVRVRLREPEPRHPERN